RVAAGADPDAVDRPLVAPVIRPRPAVNIARLLPEHWPSESTLFPPGPRASNKSPDRCSHRKVPPASEADAVPTAALPARPEGRGQPAGQVEAEAVAGAHAKDRAPREPDPGPRAIVRPAAGRTEAGPGRGRGRAADRDASWTAP